MFSPKVILWGGLASFFGGALWLMVGIVPETGGPAIVLAFVLGLGGLVGLYSRQAGQGGRLGLAGFALGIIGTVLALATLLWGFTSGRFSNSTVQREPALIAQAFLIICLGMVILGVGLVLLGITSLRGKTLHRWRGLPLGLGLLSIMQGITFWLVFYVPLSQGRNPWNPWNPGAYVLPFAMSVLLGLCWIVLGFMLMTAADAKVVPPPPASA